MWAVSDSLIGFHYFNILPIPYSQVPSSALYLIRVKVLQIRPMRPAALLPNTVSAVSQIEISNYLLIVRLLLVKILVFFFNLH
jgi:hypothetical protein